MYVLTNQKPETHLSKSSNDSPREVGPVTGAAALGGSIGLVVGYLITLAGLDVPEPVQGAIVVLLTVLGGYLVKPGTGKRRG